MINYIGVRCPVCNKKFVSSDDIVVCPVCGAPHHRDCYASKNACAFAADHLSGKVWNPPAPPQSPRQPENPAVSTCSRCGAGNPPGYVFCQVCGTMLSDSRQHAQSDLSQPIWAGYGAQSKANPISLAYGGLSPDDEIHGESVRDIALYVGQSTAYYLPRFKEIANGNRTVAFNLAALIFNFLYFFNRKLYKLGASLLALYIISLIPQFFYAQEMLPKILEMYGIATALVFNEAAANHYLSVCRIAQMIHMVIGIILAFCANRFYFDKAIEDVRRIRENHGGQNNRSGLEADLAGAGGTNMTAVLIIAGVLLAVTFTLSFVIVFMGGGMA